MQHIEKNICDSIIGTLLNIEGKTKDTLKSRIDLTQLGIKKDLQVQDEGKPRDMAPDVYVLDKVKRKEFCKVLSRERLHMDLLPTLKGESVQMETRYKGGKLMTATSY